MPTKSNNVGGRGGARAGAGRKKKAVIDKITDKLMQKMAGFDEDIYEETWEWLKKIGCHTVVSPQVIERYAMCAARWIQCEQMTNELGFLSKHPTTGKPIPSPVINIGINYMNQAVRSWNEIYQFVITNQKKKVR